MSEGCIWCDREIVWTKADYGDGHWTSCPTQADTQLDRIEEMLVRVMRKLVRGENVLAQTEDSRGAT